MVRDDGSDGLLDRWKPDFPSSAGRPMPEAGLGDAGADVRRGRGGAVASTTADSSFANFNRQIASESAFHLASNASSREDGLSDQSGGDSGPRLS